MDGVTILEVISNNDNAWFDFIFGGVIVFVGLVMFCGLVYSAIQDFDPMVLIFLLLMVLIVGLGFFVIHDGCMTYGTSNYRVFLDESANMLEFAKHYKIISQEGFTYIVQEIAVP